jgi:TRAP-type mannitol/chloroaromatic compound transport system substrate-binding protein
MSTIQTSDINIPSDPTTIKKIKDACIEISASMTRAEAEKNLQKEAVTVLSEETEIPKKYLNKLAKLYHKQNRDQVFAETEATDAFYDRVFDQQPV